VNTGPLVGNNRVIDCRAATKSYASKPVLQGIDLVVEPGICALLGANGVGKSTLLRLLSGQKKKTNLRNVSAGCDVDEVILRFGIEGILMRKFEKRFVDVLEIPCVYELYVVEADLRLRRHSSNVISDRIRQYGIASSV
jgi:translation initiation factor RLI1